MDNIRKIVVKHDVLATEPDHVFPPNTVIQYHTDKGVYYIHMVGNGIEINLYKNKEQIHPSQSVKIN